MKHPLAVVASLVATFVLGAVVALYGFGDDVTADAVGCYAYRPGSPQQDRCMEDVIENCGDTEDRSAFVACFKSGIGGRLIRSDNPKPAGEPQNANIGTDFE